MQTYLNELVFIPSSYKQAKDSLVYWGSRLSEEEKQTVGLILPYSIEQDLREADYSSIESKKIRKEWYDGEY